jgi:hypothetical protein
MEIKKLTVICKKEGKQYEINFTNCKAVSESIILEKNAEVAYAKEIVLETNKGPNIADETVSFA